MYSRPGRATSTRVIGMLTLAALTGSALAGCSSSSGQSGGSSNSANIAAADKIIQAALAPPSAITQAVPLSAKPGLGSVVFLDNGLPDTEVIANGTRQAAQAAGWSYSSITYDASSPSSLQQGFLNALSRHPTIVTE